ncbi:Alpha/Beta hydrolase protein [Colletotrichum phormii]|uniref:Alpha/Beta hydrolase protein n=1 Tax=Colletotrichum phormii TaxID=359342 RepID=A0AAI9ZZU7_9PEZI|nr:Alpha/Beta hydrolase protein [Colletotrichum phormii]KAK1640845.1 Alpha/Beta hydrolase protein [Colletotrichum phormii]
MKLQNTLIGHLLLGSASALIVPTEAHLALRRDDHNSSAPSNKSSIQWTECDLDFGDAVNAVVDALPEKLQCAKLEVPLDYTSLSSGETIQLQLIKASANKEPHMGSMLWNPGGPGGSGVESVAKLGLKLRNIVGGNYDIIGFDPRGTGKTIPYICNVTAAQTSVTRRDFETLPKGDIWNSIKTTDWESYKVTADACFRDNAKYGRFVGTPFVARDMISIADALDQGPKVNYWGVSYGTVLGQVFASMFPDRVGRLVLDSNLIADDYADTTWKTGQRDTERALHHLFDECVEAGPEACVLANFTGADTTGDSLMKALETLLEEQINDKNDTANALDDLVSLFKMGLLTELYKPLQYPQAVSRVHAALTGNWTGALIPAANALLSEWNEGGTYGVWGIACADSSFRAENVDDFYSIYRTHWEGSSFGEASARLRLLCSRWRFDAAEKIDLNALRNVRTSFPALIINGHWDPATPENTAWEISARFRNSRAVIHYGVGHGYTNHPSSCVDNIVREYFQNGKMPEIGTTCEPDMSAFEYVASEAKKAEESK